jgi:hypothetical protein
MTLEEEKKLVAEKLMGWEMMPPGLKEKYPEAAYTFEDWNPQSDRNCWPGIWEKMTVEQAVNFVREIHHLQMKIGKFIRTHWGNYTLEMNAWLLHITPPDICWKALIKVLT